MQAGCQGFRKQRAGFSLTVPPLTSSPLFPSPSFSLPHLFPFLSFCLLPSHKKHIYGKKHTHCTWHKSQWCREIQGVAASCYQRGFYSAHPRLHEPCTLLEWPLTEMFLGCCGCTKPLRVPVSSTWVTDDFSGAITSCALNLPYPLDTGSLPELGARILFHLWLGWLTSKSLWFLCFSPSLRAGVTGVHDHT